MGDSHQLLCINSDYGRLYRMQREDGWVGRVSVEEGLNTGEPPHLGPFLNLLLELFVELISSCLRGLLSF